MSVGVGELAALASAVTWAGTSTALARLGARYDAPILSALRLLIATPLLIFILVAGGLPRSFDATSLPVYAMIASGLVGYGIGDTAYIRVISRVGVQRLAPTTTAVWVALSAIGGILLLHEPATWTLLAGGLAIVAGCFLIVRRVATEPLAVAIPGSWGTGRTAGAIVLVAGAWAAATLLLAGSRGDLSAAAAGALRIPAGGLAIAFVFTATHRGKVRERLPRGRDLALIAAVGIVGTGIGSWLYIYAVAEAGAARAVLLNATSPLMTLPLAMLFLRERLKRNVAVGGALCIVGTLIVLAG
jgi:drug/metabolite transporter (DMT)-like permease